jgi:hypothetical protein
MGGFIAASAPILVTSFGIGASYFVGLASIFVAIGIAFFSGWIHRAQK